MTTIITSLIFLLSLGGAGAIAYRKIPLLVELPDVVEKDRIMNWPLIIKSKIKNIGFVKNFSYEIFLQKILSKFRVLTLKTENKTSNWLQELRERYKKKKVLKDDHYWDEIKKSK